MSHTTGDLRRYEQRQGHACRRPGAADRDGSRSAHALTAACRESGGSHGRRERHASREGPGRLTICQSGEVLPAGVSGIRIGMWAFLGAKMHVRVYSGSRILTEGSRGAELDGDSATVRSSRSRDDLGSDGLRRDRPNSQPLLLLGAEGAGRAGRRGDPQRGLAHTGGRREQPSACWGKIGLEYLRAGNGSWWSRGARRRRTSGLAAVHGTWIAFLIAALMAAVGVLAVRLRCGCCRERRAASAPAARSATGSRSFSVSAGASRNAPARGTRAAQARGMLGFDMRAALRRVPRAAWICALVALLNATAWSIITPPFQGKDEIDNYSYVEYLSAAGKLPKRRI